MKLLKRFSKNRSFRRAIIYFLVYCLFFNMPLSVVLAAPSDPLVQSGTIDAAGNTASLGTVSHLYTSDGTVIKWNGGFDIANGEEVYFHQYDVDVGGVLSAESAVLNRILTGSQTVIDGLLEGNGRVFVINPAGILFGGNAQVNVNQLVASTLGIDPIDFQNGNYEFFVGDGIGEVKNESDNIFANEGVALIAKRVLNEGTITTGPKGFVVMAAGDRVLLKEADSGVLLDVQVDSVAAPPAEDGSFSDGDVHNTGSIEAPEGQIILAAGDVFSLVADIDGKLARVDHVAGGTGRVWQEGHIHADGTDADGGEVHLLAGNEVALGSGSLTTANAGTGAVSPVPGDDPPAGGDIMISSPEKISADADARIEAIGGGVRYTDPIRKFEVAEDGDFRGSVEINGKWITPPYDVDLSNYETLIATYNAGVDPELNPELWLVDDAGMLSIGPFAGDLTVADGILPAGPAENTLYEQWIEDMSQSGVNVDLFSRGNIIVENMVTDGVIHGGSGDIALRNVYDTGGIEFLPDAGTGLIETMVHTTGGGSIYMLAGEGGLKTGDLMTDVLSSDKVSDPGRIRLLTTKGEDAEPDVADMETGSLFVKGGSYVEISAISAGDLTVKGAAVSKTNQVPSETQEVGFAQVCLVADETVYVDAQYADIRGVEKAIAVEAHGKQKTTADIRICAGDDVILTNLEDGIIASAKTSQSDSDTISSEATVFIGAGGNDEQGGTISINGFVFGEADNADLPITLRASTSGTGSPVELTAGDTVDHDGNGDPWDETNPEGSAHVALDIDDNLEAPPGDCPDCPCVDCPRPPGLRIPLDLWTQPDAGADHMNNQVGVEDVLGNDSEDLRFVIDYTNPVDEFGQVLGELVLVYDEVEDKYNFVYVPEEGFVGEITFDYIAMDGFTLITGTVTITLNNTLPTGSGDLGTIHMDTQSVQTQVALSSPVTVEDAIDQGNGYFDTLSIIEATGTDAYVGSNGGTLEYDGTEWTYTPNPATPGYVGDYDGAPDETFEVKIWDGQYDYHLDQAVTVDAQVVVELTNTLPTVGGDIGTEHMNTQLPGLDFLTYADDADNDPVVLDTLEIIDVGQGVNGGTLTKDNGTWTYTPLDGYVGSDSFEVEVWDGEYDYSGGGDPVKVTATGTMMITFDNTLPSGDTWLGTTHMDTALENVALAAGSFIDADDDTVTVGAGPYDGAVIGSDIHGGTLTYDGDWTYTPDTTELPGYVGDDVDDFTAGGYDVEINPDDKFNVQLWDGQYHYMESEVPVTGYELYKDNSEGPDIYRAKVYGTGTVSVDLTNTLPTASGDLGEVLMDTVLVIPQTGFTSPIAVEDAVDQGEGYFDDLTIVQDTYTGTAGGTLEFDGTNWIYTPKAGYVGGEEFTIKVGDGENTYAFNPDGSKQSVTSEYGTGTVTVTVGEEPPPPPAIPPAPLPEMIVWEVAGCPSLMGWLADELGTEGDKVQFYTLHAYSNAEAAVGSMTTVAYKGDIQSCALCARLKNATRVVDDTAAGRAEALANLIVAALGRPLVAPPSPEQMDIIATALATAAEEDTEYASATELVDAIVAYVDILTDEMGYEEADAVAWLMENHGEPITGDPNVGFYIGARLVGPGGP